MFEVMQMICVVGAGLGVAGIFTEMFVRSRRGQKVVASVERKQEVSLIERGFSGNTSLAAAMRSSSSRRA